jgi:hypothetical protein
VSADTCEVFISHSAVDRDLAEALVAAIRSALHISARNVRCSSVDGYRLPVGVRAEDSLKLEILTAPAFVGLLTPASISSTYVLFELGARWGADRHISPVLARGLTPSALTGPLAALNALLLSERRQILQLLDDLAAVLDKRLEPLPAFDAAVDTVVALAAGLPPSSTQQLESVVSADELRILYLVACLEHPTAKSLAFEHSIVVAKADYYVERLVSNGLIRISKTATVNGKPVLLITQPGREKLVEAGLI